MVVLDMEQSKKQLFSKTQCADTAQSAAAT